MKTDTPRPFRLKDYSPPDYLIDHVDLDIILNPAATRVRARLKIRPNPDARRATASSKPVPLRLDGEHLELTRLRIGNTALDTKPYKLTDTALILKDPPSKPFKLDIETTIDPSANKALQGLYLSRGIYCTQCEAEGFRRITYFLDRPDILSTYKVRLEADPQDAPILLSNGNLLERGTLDSGKRHYAVWEDPHPKPCYLFALVGGDLAPTASSFKTSEGRRVDLTIYVEHGKEDRAAWAMESLKRSMKWDEKRFARTYDLDIFNIVAVSDFNMGAMENKGLNIFNDRLILASPETATDATFAAIESVVAHEYFHNWTGNRITCRDWFQLCLKEGLTVYRDQEFSADERSATVQRIADVRQLRAHQFAEDAGPLAHPVRPSTYIEINNFYTATVYEKGAELVRMIATIIGEADFRAGMDLYFDRHDGDAATVEDFLRCFAEVSGKDLSQFMIWYEQAGTPKLTCTFTHDARKQTARLDCEQVTQPTPGQSRKKPQHIPIRLGLLDQHGKDIPLQLADGTAIDDGIIHLAKRSQSFVFKNLPEAPVPSLLRGFSAPVRLELELTNDELAFLVAHDGDGFNRWQAANSYATRLILAAVSALTDGRRATFAGPYTEALRYAITNNSLEPAFRAELLKLPTQADIAREIQTNVDPERIWRAHHLLTRFVARKLATELADLYDEFADKPHFKTDAAAAGRRGLRNAALTLLTARGTDDDIARVVRHFNSASNMTDTSHALYLLASQSPRVHKPAFDAFYKRWKGDHVVIDTWFAAQAQSSRGDALRNISKLIRHEKFDLTTPNKVRALIGSFAMQNPLQFNRPDGKGYAFLADQILAIDRFNPQIAARLMSAMRSWQALEPGRRQHAETQLRRITKQEDLSRDLYEIATKILEP